MSPFISIIFAIIGVFCVFYFLENYSDFVNRFVNGATKTLIQNTPVVTSEMPTEPPKLPEQSQKQTDELKPVVPADMASGAPIESVGTVEKFDLNTLPRLTTNFTFDLSKTVQMPSSIGIKELDLPKLRFTYPKSHLKAGYVLPEYGEMIQYYNDPISLTHFGYKLGKQTLEGENVVITVDMDKYNTRKLTPLGEFTGYETIDPLMLRIKYKLNDGSNKEGEIVVYYESRINNNEPVQNYTLFGSGGNMLYGHN